MKNCFSYRWQSFFCTSAGCCGSLIFDASLPFDFDQLKSSPLHFGKDFLWVSATAAHQVEGKCTSNNWFLFESAVDEHGKPRIANYQRAGIACDHWSRHVEEVDGHFNFSMPGLVSESYNSQPEHRQPCAIIGDSRGLPRKTQEITPYPIGDRLRVCRHPGCITRSAKGKLRTKIVTG